MLLMPIITSGQSNTYKSISDGVIAASFLYDVTIPDGALLKAGQRFIKTWKFKNSGKTTWDDFKLVFVEGEKMEASSPVSLPLTPPGESVDVSVTMTAPMDVGRHQGYWQLQTATGERFGPWVYVIIQVKSSTYEGRGFQAWVSHIDSDSTVIRKKAVEALSQFGPRATPILIDLFQSDPDQDIRVMALGGLASIKPLTNEILIVFLESITDPNPAISSFSLMYFAEDLRFHVGPESVPILIKAMNDKNSSLRRRLAIQLLSQLGPEAKEATSNLHDLADHDPDPVVRKLAIEVLKMIEQ
jgi:hypothetical protein